MELINNFTLTVQLVQLLTEREEPHHKNKTKQKEVKHKSDVLFVKIPKDEFLLGKKKSM